MFLYTASPVYSHCACGFSGDRTHAKMKHLVALERHKAEEETREVGYTISDPPEMPLRSWFVISWVQPKGIRTCRVIHRGLAMARCACKTLPRTPSPTRHNPTLRIEISISLHQRPPCVVRTSRILGARAQHRVYDV